jgi:hypothetical protein
MNNPSRFLALALVVTSTFCASAQDTTAPTVVYRSPLPGASVARLTEIQVQFSEGVTGWMRPTFV